MTDSNRCCVQRARDRCVCGRGQFCSSFCWAAASLSSVPLAGGCASGSVVGCSCLSMQLLQAKETDESNKAVALALAQQGLHIR
jgi:hypothetical protein